MTTTTNNAVNERLVEQTTSTASLLNNSVNITTYAAGALAYTLPTGAIVGQYITIIGVGTNGWTLAQNAGQTIHFGSQDTTTGAGGSLASTNRYDSITLRCVITDTDWVVESSVGNITVV